MPAKSEADKPAKSDHNDVNTRQLSMEDAGRAIVNEILAEEEIQEDDEKAEILMARNILKAVQRIQASLPQASPEQQHDITTIRASANELVRMHNTV